MSPAYSFWETWRRDRGIGERAMGPSVWIGLMESREIFVIFLRGLLLTGAEVRQTPSLSLTLFSVIGS
jgi:hypothetical protein